MTTEIPTGFSLLILSKLLGDMTTLKRLRDSTGLTREDFAQLAGVSLARLEKHEQGRHRISLEDAATYAKSLSRKLPITPSKLLAELAGLSTQEEVAQLPQEAPTHEPTVPAHAEAPSQQEVNV